MEIETVRISYAHSHMNMNMNIYTQRKQHPNLSCEEKGKNEYILW